MRRGDVIPDPALGPLREQIDALDREIVRLLNERARIGIEIGQAKAARGLAVHDPERERDVLRRVAAANPGPVPEEDLLALYRAVIALTRRLEGGRGAGAPEEPAG